MSNATPLQCPDEFIRFIDPRLPSAAQNALLAIAAGASHRSHLKTIPSLANRGAQLRAITLLVERGWIRKAGGEFKVIEDRPRRVATEQEREKVIAGKYVQKTLACISHPRFLLNVRGLSALAAALTTAQARCLLDLVKECERLEAADLARDRRKGTSKWRWASRHVPAAYLAANNGHPPTAPADVRQRILRIMLHGCADPADRTAIREKIETFYSLINPLGEIVLAHWWQIACTLDTEQLDWSERLDRMQRLLTSYLARRQLLRGKIREALDPEHEIEWKALQQEYPVPDVGYGPWMWEEEKVWRHFCRRYGPALGPDLRDVWVQANTELEGQSITPDEYRARLFEAAEEIAGFYPDVLSALLRGDPKAPSVREWRAAAVIRWEEYEMRRELRKALRYARDIPPRSPADDESGACGEAKRKPASRIIDLSDSRPANWAPRLAHALILKRMSRGEEPEHLKEVRAHATRAMRKRRTREPRRTVKELVRSWLVGIPPVTVSRAQPEQLVPALEEALRPTLRRVGQEYRGDDIGLREAAFTIAEYLTHRVCVCLVSDDDTRDYGTLRQAAAEIGDPDAVFRLLCAVDLAGPLDASDWQRLFGTATAGASIATVPSKAATTAISRAG